MLAREGFQETLDSLCAFGHGRRCAEGARAGARAPRPQAFLASGTVAATGSSQFPVERKSSNALV